VPWAEDHRPSLHEALQLSVELISADAERHGAEVTVALGVRATLRTRDATRYVAQTQTHCKRSAVVEPSGSAPVAFDCMARIGRQLTGWLGSISSEASPGPAGAGLSSVVP
jgi:hypothetical protein